MTETTKPVIVPDIGTADAVDVIEVMVKPGDHVNVEDSLITLEGDKATMDIPSPISGVVKSVSVKVGDKVSEGSEILQIMVEGSAKASVSASDKASKTSSQSQQQSVEETIVIPDIGTSDKVDVIEVMVSVGDTVAIEDSLITLEGDKATMDVPSSKAGVVSNVLIKVGDKVGEGDAILTLQVSGDSASKPAKKSAAAEQSQSPQIAMPADENPEPSKKATDVLAGPAVRRIAREVGIDLHKITPTGMKGRITREDIKHYVQKAMQQGNGSGGLGFDFPQLPKIDFSKYGAVKTKPLSKIKKISGANLHRNWVSIPHITQFDEADITELEAFRQQQKTVAAKQGVKLTPLVFIMKAVVATLREFPVFNASLTEDGQSLVMKQYFHIGVAVDTPNGLVVPVIRDVDRKGMYELAVELAEISKKAREKGLSLKEMQGGCFTISSLGGIGGTAFTPIINAPEVAILGVSRHLHKPVYLESEDRFVPRLMLPLSLSYDHRVIDGADGARFIVALSGHLSDIRKILL